jgi:type IV pilus assembly protein PilC
MWKALRKHLPGISGTVHWAEATLWLQCLGALVRAGIPIHDALGASQAALADADIAPNLVTIHQAVRQGQPLHQCMALIPHFPDWAQQLCAVGEASGTLDPLLNQAGDAMEAQLERDLTRLSGLLEPLLLALMGLVIGGIVLALYLPILQLGALA